MWMVEIKEEGNQMSGKLGYMVATIEMKTDIEVSKTGAVKVKPIKGAEQYAYVSEDVYKQVVELLDQGEAGEANGVDCF